MKQSIIAALLGCVSATPVLKLPVAGNIYNGSFDLTAGLCRTHAADTFIDTGVADVDACLNKCFTASADKCD